MKDNEKSLYRIPNEIFRKIAKERGMSDNEITEHLEFIDNNYEKWKSANRNIRIEKSGKEGLKRTVEYIAETGTVITHFKRKIGPLGTKKGPPLGEGRFAIVKQSIINV